MKNLLPIIIALLIAINAKGTYTLKPNNETEITTTIESFSITMNDETITYDKAEFEKFEVRKNLISIYHNGAIDNYYIEP